MTMVGPNHLTKRRLRLHLVATVHGLPVGWALTGAKADERQALVDIGCVQQSGVRVGPDLRYRRVVAE